MARTDKDVWVIGSAHGAPRTWHYDGSSWAARPPGRYPIAKIYAHALGSNGVLYLAGSNGTTHRGIILGWEGSQWTNLSPANPPHDYKALTVTADGTLIAGGGDHNDGTLQERSGTMWTTVFLSAPVNSVDKVSLGPDGTVYGVGSAAGALVLIKQSPDSPTATVLDPSAMDPSTFTNEAGVVALGLDVWLLGAGEPHDGWHHPWFAYDDSDFGGAGRRWSQVALGSSGADPRSGHHCWHRDGESLTGSARCGHHHHHQYHRGAHRTGCKCHGPSRLQKDTSLVW